MTPEKLNGPPDDALGHTPEPVLGDVSEPSEGKEPAPRHFSEDEKHRREIIIAMVRQNFYIDRRLGRVGLTMVERRARRAMRRSPHR